ncbi:photosystem I assembly protein Ycf3 [bacterium BMS3Abin07]|nr:photosystem I assembly protein Ycf3 [bacterium BMS3Abin07]GBE31318.1 photosystem I assembly protein Ycf3 [bacterium BMS3Bbin05]
MKIFENRLSIIFFLICIVLVSCNNRGDKDYAPPASPGETIKSSVSYDRDIVLLRGIVKREPGNLNAWVKLGNVLMDSKHFEEAISAYENALKLDPGNVNVRVDVGTCYRRSGKPRRAVDEYNKAIRINPKHPYAHKNKGVVLAFDLHRNDEAIREFETYLKLFPNAPDALQVSGIINELKKNR